MNLKIVTSEEMIRLERLAIERGSSSEAFMETAGEKIALAIAELIERRHLSRRVLLLVGKGNKGGDAYTAGAALLKQGYEVYAVALYNVLECSPLNQKMREIFEKEGGKIDPFQTKIDLFEPGLIVDGLLGTGFKGKIESPISDWIKLAVESGKPILAIDIPSGLNGSTGEIGDRVIVAEETIALGLPKIGCFLRQGWNCVGNLRVADFGLPKEIVADAKAVARFPFQSDLKLPEIIRTRHKYEAGYVLGLGGSKQLPGAPKMAGLAALRSGAGIVRLFSFEEIGSVPLELISVRWTLKEWERELKKARAVFIGPGLENSKKLGPLLKAIQVPCVLDAGALRSEFIFPKHVILTPHRGEVLRLLNLEKEVEEEVLFEKVTHFCKTREVTLILKGAPTFIFSPGELPVLVARGDPGMATAGSGDVLTGILAALLAAGLPSSKAAILGVWLHAVSGEIAAVEKTSYSLIAGDLIEFLPKAFRSLLYCDRPEILNLLTK